jgi:hypothetical protein
MNTEVQPNSPFIISQVVISARSSQSPCLYCYETFGEAPSGAILRAFDNTHEDSETFPSKRPEKTLCNIIACLSFTKVMNPLHWHHSDVNEILKIGHKLLCGLTRSIIEQDQEALWKTFESFKIGAVQLTVRLASEESGTFSGRRTLLPTAESSREQVQQQVKISEIRIKPSN